MTHRDIWSNGLRFHVAEAGPDTGPLVLLLHGFPEHWYSWRHQLPALAARGLHVVAPDLRGVNLSDKPPRVGDYDLDALAADVSGLIGALGARDAIVVGHDWGAAVAWHVAALHPERVRKLAVLNCPPVLHLAEHLRRNPRQLLRSWYVFFFQLPWVPERVLGAGALARHIDRAFANPAALTAADRAANEEAWRQPGSLRGGLNYYRAAARRALSGGLRRPAPVRAPVLVVWGDRDIALGAELTRGLEPYAADGLRIEHLPDAGHFVHQDAPDVVNRLLAEFIGDGA